MGRRQHAALHSRVVRPPATISRAAWVHRGRYTRRRRTRWRRVRESGWVWRCSRQWTWWAGRYESADGTRRTRRTRDGDGNGNGTGRTRAGAGKAYDGSVPVVCVPILALIRLLGTTRSTPASTKYGHQLVNDFSRYTRSLFRIRHVLATRERTCLVACLLSRPILLGLVVVDRPSLLCIVDISPAVLILQYLLVSSYSRLPRVVLCLNSACFLELEISILAPSFPILPLLRSCPRNDMCKYKAHATNP